MSQLWVPSNAGTYNTHMGYALEDGDLGWLIKNFPAVSRWYLQEIPNRRTIHNALEHAGVRGQWMILSPKTKRAGLPHMIVKRRRYKLIKFEAPILASPRFARARSTMVLFDKKTKRYLGGSNVHVDPMGQGWERASPFSKSVHSRQVRAHADWLGQWDQAEIQKASLLEAAGDFNETLDERIQLEDRRTSTQLMERAGLQPAWRLAKAGTPEVNLDDIFFRPSPFVRVGRRFLIDTPSRRADHEAVVVRTKVLVNAR